MLKLETSRVIYATRSLVQANKAFLHINADVKKRVADISAANIHIGLE
jgi:hypothetical protein